jgi:hypothetical protein
VRHRGSDEQGVAAFQDNPARVIVIVNDKMEAHSTFDARECCEAGITHRRQRSERRVLSAGGNGEQGEKKNSTKHAVHLTSLDSREVVIVPKSSSYIAR